MSAVFADDIPIAEMDREALVMVVQELSQKVTELMDHLETNEHESIHRQIALNHAFANVSGDINEVLIAAHRCYAFLSGNPIAETNLRAI